RLFGPCAAWFGSLPIVIRTLAGLMTQLAKFAGDKPVPGRRITRRAGIGTPIRLRPRHRAYQAVHQETGSLRSTHGAGARRAREVEWDTGVASRRRRSDQTRRLPGCNDPHGERLHGALQAPLGWAPAVRLV